MGKPASREQTYQEKMMDKPASRVQREELMGKEEIKTND